MTWLYPFSTALLQTRWPSGPAPIVVASPALHIMDASLPSQANASAGPESCCPPALGPGGVCPPVTCPPPLAHGDSQAQLRKCLSSAVLPAQVQVQVPAGAPALPPGSPCAQAEAGDCRTWESALPTLSTALPLSAGSLWSLAICRASITVFAAGRAACVAVKFEANGRGAAAPPQVTVLNSGADNTNAVLLPPGSPVLYTACTSGAVRTFDATSCDAVPGQHRPRPVDFQHLDHVTAAFLSHTYCLAALPATPWLFAGSGDGCVRCWAIGPGSSSAGQVSDPPVALLPEFTWPDDHQGAVIGLTACAIELHASDSGATPVVAVVSAGEDGSLVCRHLASPGDVATCRATPVAWRNTEPHAGRGVCGIVCDPSPNALPAAAPCAFSAGWDGAITCTRLNDGSQVAHWPVVGYANVDEGDEMFHHIGVGTTSLALCPRGRLIYVGCADGIVRAMDRATGRVEMRLSAGVHRERTMWGAICAMAVSHDGEHVYAAGTDKCLRVWQVALPLQWAPARDVHARFPAPFGAAVQQLLLGAADSSCPLGSAFSGLDESTRMGLLGAITRSLASEVYSSK